MVLKADGKGYKRHAKLFFKPKQGIYSYITQGLDLGVSKYDVEGAYAPEAEDDENGAGPSGSGPPEAAQSDGKAQAPPVAEEGAGSRPQRSRKAARKE